MPNELINQTLEIVTIPIPKETQEYKRHVRRRRKAERKRKIGLRKEGVSCKADSYAKPKVSEIHDIMLRWLGFGKNENLEGGLGLHKIIDNMYPHLEYGFVYYTINRIMWYIYRFMEFGEQFPEQDEYMAWKFYETLNQHERNIIAIIKKRGGLRPQGTLRKIKVAYYDCVKKKNLETYGIEKLYPQDTRG